MKIEKYKPIFLKEESPSADQEIDIFSVDGMKANYKNPTKSLEVFSNLDNEKIPVTKYFRYGYSYPKKLESLVNVLMLKLSEENFWNLFAECKPSIIDFNSIVPTIDYLSRLEIHVKYQGQTDLECLPYFIEYNGRCFCITGHIETVNQAKFNKRIRGKCISYDKLMGLVKVKMIYQKLFENEIPDKFEIPLVDISFRIFGKLGYSNEVKHSDPAQFMSKIIFIVKNYIQKNKDKIFSFSGSTRDKEDYDKPTTRIKIYQKMISKFIKPENILRLPNKILFFTESKKLNELNVISKVDKKSVSKVKSKIVKVNSKFRQRLLDMYRNKFNLEQIEDFLIDYFQQKISKDEIFNIIFQSDNSDYPSYIFIQVDKKFENGYLPFIVEFDKDIIYSKKLEQYDLENSPQIKKLNQKGKLKEL